MSRARVYIDQPIRAGNDIALRGEQARYAGRVLRLRIDDELILFNGKGGEFRGTIKSISNNEIRVAIDEHLARETEATLGIHLLQGISRGERMDFVMQKATELGVRRVTPVYTDFSVVKLDAKRSEKRLQHWRGIATSACEQAGRNLLPDIDPPVAIRTWFGANHAAGGTRLILAPGARDSLRSVPPTGNELTVLIGPEGGFSDSEIDMAELAGFRAIGFGPRILRTETAAVAVLAALQTLYGDLAP